MSINSSSTLAITGSKDGSVHVVNIATGRVCASLASYLILFYQFVLVLCVFMLGCAVSSTMNCPEFSVMICVEKKHFGLIVVGPCIIKEQLASQLSYYSGPFLESNFHIEQLSLEFISYQAMIYVPAL